MFTRELIDDCLRPGQPFPKSFTLSYHESQGVLSCRPKQKKMREQLRQLAMLGRWFHMMTQSARHAHLRCNSDLLFLALDADMEGEFIARQVARVSQPLMRSSAVWRFVG